MLLTLFWRLTDDSGTAAATSNGRQARGRRMAYSADGEVGDRVPLQQRMDGRVSGTFRTDLGQQVAGVVYTEVCRTALPPPWTIGRGYQITVQSRGRIVNTGKRTSAVTRNTSQSINYFIY
jgi:hypothetical protein